LSKKTFISEVLKTGGTIGALSPSSSFLAHKMLSPIDFETAKCIIEFGPGTGIFTHKLLEKMTQDSRLFIFEINPAFFAALKTINDNRLIVVNDSAENCMIYLKQYHQENADYIVSSLPFAMIPDQVVDAILENAYKVLSEKGKFIQFQYSLNALSKLKTIFNKVKVKFTFLNLPPAFVFICRK
jgi:phospholipid N-methyltransferase